MIVQVISIINITLQMEKSKNGKRNNREDGNTGRGRGKGRHSGGSMKMNPGGMKNEKALQPPNASTSVTNVIRYDSTFSLNLHLCRLRCDNLVICMRM